MVGPTGSTLYWHPANQGERACAYTLRKKGLLEGSTVSYGDAFYLSDEGLRVALELRAATA